MISRSLEPVACLNGQLVPLRQACVSIVDNGIVQAATVTERIRTFAHRPYMLADHLDRLRQSLSRTGIAAPAVVDELPTDIDAVVAHNRQLLEDWHDLAIVIFVTPGVNRGFAGDVDGDAGPTVCIHTSVIPTPQWAELATQGVQLVTPSVKQIPPQSLDPGIKHRSRLHWFMADQEVRQSDPSAMALLLDANGHVTETSSGNLMIYDGQRLLTPRDDQVLGGISRQVVARLASAVGIETVAADLTPEDVVTGREAFLTSTGYCLLPVTRLNGRPVGDGRPGLMAQRLLQDWSTVVGVDIPAQQQRAAGIEDP